MPLDASRFEEMALALRQGVTDQEQIASMVEYLEDSASTLRGNGNRAPADQALHVIRRTLQTSYVAIANLQKINAQSFLLLCPDAMPEEIPKGRNHSTVAWDRFRLDVALMLTNRDTNYKEPHVRFSWADSSPQGPWDFIMWKELAVALKNILTVARAIVSLQTTRGGVLSDMSDPDVPLSLLAQRAAWGDVLSTMIRVLVYPACTMGQGHTGAEDKVVAALHDFSLETWDIQHTKRHIDEYQCYTSDMGTEIKVSDFVVERQRMHLYTPDWLFARDAVAPLKGEFDESCTNHLVQCDGNEFLRNAFALPGANHIIHNIVKTLHECLGYYGTFLSQLKVLEQILTHPGRNERLVAKCMLGTPWGQHASVVTKFSTTLHEPRWSATAHFCKAVVRPAAILRKCWKEKEYTGNGEHELKEREWIAKGYGGKKFIPTELTAVLRDPMFRFYLHFIIAVQSILVKVHSWFDGCPCHECLVKGLSAHFRKKALIGEGLVSGICPCTSCRGWEVVDGKLGDVVKELGDLAQKALELLVAERSNDGATDPLTDSQVTLLLSDFHAIISCLQAGFTVRFSFTKHLPYVLLGLSHPVQHRRQHFARVCLALYDKTPEARHHRKSVAFLKVGTVVRADIELLGNTGVTTPNLELQIAPMYLMPFGDRQIEMEHKPLSDVARKNMQGRRGHMWSVQRLKSIERRLEERAWRDVFVAHFASLEKLKQMIKVLGFQHHPALRDYLTNSSATRPSSHSMEFVRKHAHTRCLIEVLFFQKQNKNQWNTSTPKDIVYRQDISLKYQKLTEAKRISTHRDAVRRKLQPQKIPPKRSIPGSVEQLLLQNAWGHLKTVAAGHSVITVPQRTDNEMQMITASISSLLYPEEAVSEAEDHHPDDGADAAAVVVEGPARHEALVDPPDDPLLPLCFKVCSPTLGKVKTLATFFPETGAQLGDNTIGVSLHTVHSADGATLVADIHPRSFDADSNMSVLVCTDFLPGCSLEALVASVHGWSAKGTPEPQYALPIFNVPLLDVHQALAQLLQTDQGSIVQVDTEQEPWRSMLDRGFVRVVPRQRSRIQGKAPVDTTKQLELTTSGLRSITTAAVYKESQPVFKVRELPLPELTCFEMARKLQLEGWEWRRFPASIKARTSLHHDTEAPHGVWYTLGATLIAPYLQCLLSGAELRRKYGVLTFPHYAGRAPVKQYTGLLQGKPIEDIKPPKRLALQAEFEDDEVQAIEDKPEAEIDEQLEQEELVLAIEDGESHPPEPDIPEPNPQPGPPPSPPSAEESPLPAPESDGDDDRPHAAGHERQQLESDLWGCFKIARIPTQRGGTAFEATCVFHKLSKVTACKKTFAYTTETEDLVLGALRHWCNTARQYNRQRYHMDSMKTWMEVPVQSEQVLLQGQIPLDQKPNPGSIKTDKELDKEEAAAIAAHQRGGRARGRGRVDGQGRARGGKGGRAGRGRGRVGGKGSGDPARSSLESSTASSSSSSSSSSS